MEAGSALYRRGLSSRATKEGFALLIMAAKRGVVGAQYAVAAELATGETVKKDERRAASWYRKGAMAGHGEAQYNLALMYFYGEGMKKNIKEHRRWLEKAARRRDLLALRRLYEAHRDGSFGYIRDLRKAKYWGERYAHERSVDSLPVHQTPRRAN